MGAVIAWLHFCGETSEPGDEAKYNYFLQVTCHKIVIVIYYSSRGAVVALCRDGAMYKHLVELPQGETVGGKY